MNMRLTQKHAPLGAQIEHRGISYSLTPKGLMIFDNLPPRGVPDWNHYLRGEEHYIVQDPTATLDVRMTIMTALIDRYMVAIGADLGQIDVKA